MTPRLRTSLRSLAALVVVGLSGSVSAQVAAGPPETVRMRLGPVFLDPTISLSNAGVDSNVFNDPKSATPRSDATVTATPRTDFWVRFGPSWLHGSIREDLVYYRENASERSANNAYNLTWTIPLNRITIRPTTTFTNTRERPGFEIDARAPRSELEYGGLVDVKWLSKSSLVLRGSRHQVLFDQTATFLNINLHDALNRVTTAESVSVEYHVTPLTTVSADYFFSQDRFTFDTPRNSESRTLGASVRLDPAALVKGTATIGYMDYRPNDPATPGYKGMTAVAVLTYVFLGSTKVNVNVTRGVQYSYDINQPYYIQTGGSAVLTQQLFGPVDVMVIGGLHQLAYENRAGAVVFSPDRTDHLRSFGGGVGYHLSRDARLGFTIEKDRRDSVLDTREYTGLRYGFSVTYGGS